MWRTTNGPWSASVVQELLGHANIEATMIYAHLSESRLKDAVAKLDEPAPSRPDAGHFCEAASPVKFKVAGC